MSLSASMWTSVTGLLVHGEKMNVVGNNIANVNTVAFKGSRRDCEDFVHQEVYAATGPTQVGRGVSIGAIYGNFTQGSFETSTDPTDIAISGRGFFKVKPKDTNMEYYTRAGNFRFDADGYLVDPHGYVLQGWQIQRANPSLASTGSAAGGGGITSNINLKGSGVPVDVKLDGFTCQPKHTTNMTANLNLDATDGGDKSSNVTIDPATGAITGGNPFFSLFEDWDATNLPNDIPALGENSYAHQHTMTIYDEGGTAHKVTIYFDQVANNTLVNDPAAVPPTNPSDSTRYWEYMVTMDPAEDVRDFNPDPDAVQPATNKMKGVLMAGTLTFDSSGQFKDMSAYVPTVGASDAAGAGGAGTMDDLATWTLAPVSSNGYPMFSPNFAGHEGVSNIWYGIENPNLVEGNLHMVELDLGLKNKGPNWNGETGASTVVAGTTPTAAGVGYSVAGMDTMGTNNVIRENSSTVSFPSSSAELFAKQDGYTFGYLSSVYVDRDGILYGKYSNGQDLALYQITLYDVPSKHNLRREGGNLFSATNESGDVVSGPANSAGFGSVHGNSLEQSNVDLATEFVQMITTQRGFQANSKSITTVDTMLETVIGMKR